MKRFVVYLNIFIDSYVFKICIDPIFKMYIYYSNE